MGITKNQYKIFSYDSTRPIIFIHMLAMTVADNYYASNKVNHGFNTIVFISHYQTYPQSDTTTDFPIGFHVGSPAVICVFNYVNHVFNTILL